MHELGVLRHIVSTVDGIAAKNSISRIKHITLDVGESSGFEPIFFEKLFPVATDRLPLYKGAELRLNLVPGKGLQIKEIGY